MEGCESTAAGFPDFPQAIDIHCWQTGKINNFKYGKQFEAGRAWNCFSSYVKWLLLAGIF